MPDLLDLLAKFAAGVGGRRTGELMRRGLIRVEVTPAGYAELEIFDPGRSGARPDVSSNASGRTLNPAMAGASPAAVDTATAGENPAPDRGEMLSEEDFYWKHESPTALRAKLAEAGRLGTVDRPHCGEGHRVKSK